VRDTMLIVGYFSPDVVLPVTSIVATIAGVAMMLGRGSLRYVRRLLERGTGRALRGATRTGPHFRAEDKAHEPATHD